MAENLRSRTLRSFETELPSGSSPGERFFVVLLLLMVGGGIALGAYLHTVKLTPEEFGEQVVQAVKTRFVIEEKRKPPPPKPEPKPDAPKEKAEPIDLTKNPVLGQKTDDVQQQPSNAPVVRRVYGLRRVFSVGIGAGGNISDAVIGKLGNTLATDIDTFKATDREVKGQVVSIATVTSLPQLKKYVKPEYTDSMKANGVEGIVKVKVLVNADGKVAQAIVLNDLGFGTAQQALKACLDMVFIPGMRGSEPVNTWITVSIRFVLT